MTPAQQRKVQRVFHLTAALVVVGYVYGPLGAQLRDVVRFVVLPVLVVIAMWQAPRVRRLRKTLSRKRGLGLTPSASYAGRGDGKVDVARASRGGRG